MTASAAARSRAKFLRDIGLYNAVRKRLFLCCIAMLPVGHRPSAQYHIVVASWPKVTAAATLNGSDLRPHRRRQTHHRNPRRVVVSSMCAGISATFGSRAIASAGLRANALKLNGFASDVAPTHRGGRAGARANHPYTLRWERPDAERQPNLSAVRSSLGNIATVSRGASPRWEALHHRHNLTPLAA